MSFGRDAAQERVDPLMRDALSSLGLPLVSDGDGNFNRLTYGFISEYPKPDDAKKHVDEAIVQMEHFAGAIKKVRSSREGKPMEKVPVPYCR